MAIVLFRTLEEFYNASFGWTTLPLMLWRFATIGIGSLLTGPQQQLLLPFTAWPFAFPTCTLRLLPLCHCLLHLIQSQEMHTPPSMHLAGMLLRLHLWHR